MQPLHQPAMVPQVLEYIGNPDGRTVADFTLGAGGHARHLLERGAFVVGLDRDPTSLELARPNLAPFGDRCLFIHGKMSEAEALLAAHGIETLDACLIDAGGLGMHQLADESRSFSVNSESRLDFRLDRSSGGITAHDVVNRYLDKDLRRVFRIIGKGREELHVTARIIAARQRRPIQTTAQLADLIAATVARGRPYRRIEAAPYLMAIRVEVNDELTELRAGLEAASRLLSPNGTVVVLTWHSAEHRLCKQTLRRLASPCQCPPAFPCVCGKKPVVEILTRKALFPDAQEVQANPAARSARLHAARKLPPH